MILSLLAVLMLSPAVQAGGPVGAWIEMLSSERFVDRQRATVSLIKLGDQSIDSLRTAASEADAEVSRRAVDVLENLLSAKDSAVAARARLALQVMTKSDDGRLARRAFGAIVRANRRLQAGAVDYFETLGGKVTGGSQIDLSDSRVKNASLAHVGVFSETLEMLALHHTSISDQGLVHLSGMNRLEILNLHHTRVRGPGLAHLSQLTELSQLDLRNTKLTDVGLEHLKNATKLEMLYLSQTPLTDAGLDRLPVLPKLKHLSLHGTAVTDAAIGRLLKRMPHVKVGQ